MLAVCKYLVFVQVYGNVAGNNVFLNLAARTGEGDRSVVRCFVLLPFYKDGSYISCSPVLWYYPSVKNLLEYDGQSLWPSH